MLIYVYIMNLININNLNFFCFFFKKKIRMNAHSLLLTHFSQRYPKVPVFTDDHGRVGISFDLMQVSIGELYKLPKFVKALKVLYADENEAANEDDDIVYEEGYNEDEDD